MALYTAQFLQEKIQKALEADHVNVEDISNDCGMRFSSVIVSSKFEGKSLVQRQRMIFEILDEEMKTIHAFSQKTITPEQWAKLQQS